MGSISPSPPASDECEVSIFGPGFGESICLHLGDGKWAIIDSCVAPGQTDPAPLVYLQSLGLDVAASVALIVVTHWHDDHVRGLGKIVDAVPEARIACTAAVGTREVLAFLELQEGGRGRTGSGVDELGFVLDRAAERSSAPVWVKHGVPLYPDGTGLRPELYALSPSDDDLTRVFGGLASASASSPPRPRTRIMAPPGPNRGSIALWFEKGDVSVLLGADLDDTGNPQTGWSAVLARPLPERPASLVKVPHHGSKGSHHQGMWDDLLAPSPIALLTPFVRGSVALPSDEDLQRLDACAGTVYLTAPPALATTVPYSPQVATAIGDHPGPLEEVVAFGQIQARRPFDGAADWSCIVVGSAFRVASRT